MTKKNTGSVQEALIPDEITPLMLLALTPKASSMKDAAAAFRLAASRMLDIATKGEYIAKYKNIDPVTDALYDAIDLAQHIFDAANAVDDLINYPVEARERVVRAHHRRRARPGRGPGHRRDRGGLRWASASTAGSGSTTSAVWHARHDTPGAGRARPRSSDPHQ